MTRGERQSWIRWCVATGIAAVVLLIGGIQFVQASVYSRPEGEELEEEVQELRDQHREDKIMLTEELRLIRQKIDKVYEIMIKEKG